MTTTLSDNASQLQDLAHELSLVGLFFNPAKCLTLEMRKNDHTTEIIA